MGSGIVNQVLFHPLEFEWDTFGHVIAQSVISQSPRQVKKDWCNKGMTYRCHLNRKPIFV
jgi:hypothetical protein